MHVMCKIKIQFKNSSIKFQKLKRYLTSIMLSVLCQYGTENLKLILYLTICMWKRFFKKGKILTNVLTVFVKNSFKESFYGKKN